MLELLSKYAIEHDLFPEPGFQPKKVRWAIVCDEKARFQDVIELGDTNQKKNLGQTFPKCPNFSQREMVARGSTKSQFLIETSEVVALSGDKPEDKKIIEKHKYFIELLRLAGESMPELLLLAEELSNIEVITRIRSRLVALKAKADDKITFLIKDSFLVESDRWRDWYRIFRKGLIHSKASPGNARRCFLTGELIEPVRTHDTKIKGLTDVGGLSTGDVLIGYQQESFWSYGFEQSLNAAMSEESATMYCTGLNHLIETYGYRLAGIKVVHWFNDKDISADEDPFNWLVEGDEQKELTAQHRAKKLLEALRTGERVDLKNNYFYALTMSGASGRIMIRDWMEGQFEELVSNIHNWFDDLKIVNYTGNRIIKSPKMERIITSLLKPQIKGQKYENWVKPLGSARISLWKAAVRGELIPYSVLAQIVIEDTKFRISATLEEAEKKDRREAANAISLLHTRMGLMKAYHLRKTRAKGVMSMSQDLRPYLNENHPHPAYHCGRLMSVLARLQSSALGNVGAGVIQRYFAAASSTPALVLGRITVTSQHHLSKLEPGLAYWYENKISNIWARIKDNLPRTLTLEEQSLFALGYYQQMADFRNTYTSDSNQNKEGSNEQSNY